MPTGQGRGSNISRLCRTAVPLLALAPLVACGGSDNNGSQTPWVQSVPKATCGSSDRVEPGLQGQTSLADRQSGASQSAYTCNLQLVSQVQEEGAEWQLTWFNDCAYFSVYNNPNKKNPGVPVIDVSNPTSPKLARYLNASAMIDPWESLKVNEPRKLLGATKGPGFGPSQPTDNSFSFYDISADCTNPKLLSDKVVPGHTGHAGDWAPDGMTYYGTGAGGTGFTAMDVSDPSNPKEIWHAADGPGGINSTHDISISDDGNRAYLTHWGNFVPFGLPGPNGLVILDTSAFQKRTANPPQPPKIGEMYWTDGGVAQQTIPVTWNGKPYIIFTDETGVAYDANPATGRNNVCKSGLPPFGFTRIIDITDETNPKLVAKLMLEVNDPANCAAANADYPTATAALDNYGYSAHYCTPDTRTNPRVLLCGYWGAGLRVFDVRNPYRPKEIAYFKPPAQRTKTLYGSAMWNDYGGADRTTDRMSAMSRLRSIGGTDYVWATGQDNGFMVLKFTKPLSQLLP